jgi:ribosomal protein L24E
MTIEQIKDKAFSLGATAVGYSKRAGKKYYVEYDGKIIHFGSDVGQTFLDHKDESKRASWRARHSKIKNKAGEYVYKLKESPEYWNWHLTW